MLQTRTLGGHQVTPLSRTTCAWIFRRHRGGDKAARRSGVLPGSRNPAGMKNRHYWRLAGYLFP